MLAARVLARAATSRDQPALVTGSETRSYHELVEGAGRIARVLQPGLSASPRFAAILGGRSAATYEAVLGTLIAGAGYVPLNPKFPSARNARMLDSSGATALVVSRDCSELVPEIIAAIERPLRIVFPDREDQPAWCAAHPRHTYVLADEVSRATPKLEPPAVDPSSIAYLLFTSGSTGDPKGVMVTHANVLAFLDAVQPTFAICETDRCSQMFDLTFDLSVFDLFLSWSAGAALHVPAEAEVSVPDAFVKSRALTVWFSVPSVAMLLRQMRRLEPDGFPSLRLSLFCGERLPVAAARAWQECASRSRVYNLYGPTEVTIACTMYRWDPESSEARAKDGVVPIGVALDALTAAVVDDSYRLLPHGQKGELCMKGPQVSAGYWRDAAKTSDRFIAMSWDDGPDNRWYRTGDVAFVDDAGVLIHCGRNDEQVKLFGYRIELGEVEHVLRAVAGTDFAAVLPYPTYEGGVRGLTAVIAGSALDEETVLTAMAGRLPEYMVPKEVVLIAALPLNPNGKIDRPALLQLLIARDEAL